MNEERNRKHQLLTIFCTFILTGMLALSTGSLLPFIRDERGLSYAFAGLIVSLHSVGNLFSSFFSGALGTIIGRKKSILLFDFFFPVSFLLIIFGNDPVLLAIAYLLTGVARGANSNYCNSLVSEIAPGKASILNGLHAMFSVGAFLFPIILTLITSRNDAKWILACFFMVIMGTISFLLYAFIPDHKQPERRKENAADKSFGSDFGFFQDRIFLLVVPTLFFYLCAETGVIGWMVTYFTDTGYLSKELSGLTASILWIMMLAGRLLTAWGSSKTDKRKLLFAMSIGIVLFFILLLFARNPILIVLLVMGFGFSMAGIYPTVVSFAGDLMKRYPLAWSFILTLASLGGIVMPALIGAVAEGAGIFYGISTIAAAVVADFLCLQLLIRKAA